MDAANTMTVLEFAPYVEAMRQTSRCAVVPCSDNATICDQHGPNATP
jgi:hypothetical protein